MNQAHALSIEACADDLLVDELISLSSLLGRYTVWSFTPDGGCFPLSDEKMLAERLAAAAVGMRARVARREREAPSTSRCGFERGSRTRTVLVPSRQWGQPSLPSNDAAAEWPVLSPLGDLPGPPWQFRSMRDNAIAGSRSCGSHQETVWIAGDGTAKFRRVSAQHSTGRPAVRLDVSGPLAAVVRVLQQAACWEEEP